MDNILKQRLVGALILLALGVVFWPIIFVEPEPNLALGEPARVPHRPEINTAAIAPATAEGLRASPALDVADTVNDATSADPNARIEDDRARAPVANVTAAPTQASRVAVKPLKASGNKTKDDAKTRDKPPEKPAIDADGVPIGWILQVASITRADKAEALRMRLNAMGYKAYVKKVRRDDAVLMRVYVGPKFERAKLVAMQATIDEEFGVKSMVRRYIP